MNEPTPIRKSYNIEQVQAVIKSRDDEIRRLRWWLAHIGQIADCSDGVEFYSMLTDKALSGCPALGDD